MPGSTFEGFYVNVEDENGNITQLAGATVEVYDAVAETDIDTLTADSNGFVAGGTLSSAPGRVIFRVENHNGLAGCVVQITTD